PNSIQKYYSAVVETLIRSEAIPLAVLNRDANVVEMNEASSRMLGYQRADVIGEPIMRMIDPGSRSELQDALELSQNGETNQRNILITHR
ncbi:PAS domain-containing protein, partial [Mycobacterium kansasii]